MQNQTSNPAVDDAKPLTPTFPKAGVKSAAAAAAVVVAATAAVVVSAAAAQNEKDQNDAATAVAVTKKVHKRVCLLSFTVHTIAKGEIGYFF